MLIYILKRIALMLPTLLGALTITFVVVQFVPGGTVEQIMAESCAGSGGDRSGYRAGRDSDGEKIAELKKIYGIKKRSKKRDGEIKALAARGGGIGIAGKSGFLKQDGLDNGSTVDEMIDHVEYVRNLVGIEHVCIGTDVGDERKYTLESMREFHAKPPEVAIIGHKLRTDSMPPIGVGPGTHYDITAGLVKRGFSDNDIRLVLGDNVNRVLRAVWGS